MNDDVKMHVAQSLYNRRKSEFLPR